MNPKWRLLRGVLAVAMVAMAGSAAMPGGVAGAPSPDAGPAGAFGETVTLLTGDRVTVDGTTVVAVRPAPGRENVGFLRRLQPDGLHVLPADAVRPLSSGRLDSRLFNVSKLIEFGFGDRSRRDVPIIADLADAGPPAARPPSVLSTAGASVSRSLPSIGAAAVRVGKDSAATFWAGLHGAGALAAGIDRILLDGPVRATLDESVPRIGAPEAWRAGHTGRDTTTAVLDTGIDGTHPDLADAVLSGQDFTGSESGAADRFGHGTHVASIITGSGAAQAGRYRGVAPDTRLLNGKVINDDGYGLESWIIAGCVI